jgi:integrase/recombinase XerD
VSKEATLDGVAKALARFEAYSTFRDFKLFHIQQAVAFKDFLSKQESKKSSGEKFLDEHSTGTEGL